MSKKKPDGIKAILDQLEQLAAKSPDFAKLFPEYAKELLDQFVKQSEHERQMDLHKNKMEEKAQEGQFKVTYLGQCFGLIIGLTAIVNGARGFRIGRGRRQNTDW